jgi:hypothetical protein
MAEKLQKLQIVLLNLHMIKLEYIEEINKNAGSSTECPFLIPKQRMLNNIEKLITIVSQQIQIENPDTSHFDEIISLIHGNNSKTEI